MQVRRHLFDHVFTAKNPRFFPEQNFVDTREHPWFVICGSPHHHTIQAVVNESLGLFKRLDSAVDAKLRLRKVLLELVGIVGLERRHVAVLTR